MSLERLFRDEEEALNFFLGEEFEKMFVKIGERAINLNNVEFMERSTYDNRDCVTVWFSGYGPLRIYRKEPGYVELCVFIDERTALLHD